MSESLSFYVHYKYQYSGLTSINFPNLLESFVFYKTSVRTPIPQKNESREDIDHCLVCKGSHNKEYYILEGLNKRNLFCHSPGSWTFNTKVSAGELSSEASLLGLQMGLADVSSYGPFSVYVHHFCQCVGLNSLLSTDTSQIELTVSH